MNWLVTILAVVWVCGLLLIAGQYLNDLRIVLNNVAPGAAISTLPPRPNWLRDTAGVVSLASFESLIIASAALTIGRIFKLNLEPRVSRCDPSCLNEAGRRQLDSAARHERFALAWAAGGLVAVVLIGSYLNLT